MGWLGGIDSGVSPGWLVVFMFRRQAKFLFPQVIG